MFGLFHYCAAEHFRLQLELVEQAKRHGHGHGHGIFILAL
jgi:hypothetical protein